MDSTAMAFLHTHLRYDLCTQYLLVIVCPPGNMLLFFIDPKYINVILLIYIRPVGNIR